MSVILAAGLLEPYMGLIFWKALAFGLLLFLLYKFAWGPILKALDERETTISNSLQRAEIALAEARQIAEDNERARRESEAEAQRILREARDAATQIRTEELEKTQERIRRMEDQFRAEMEVEKLQIMGQLRAEVADLAIQAAERILGENLDEQRQRRLVDSFIQELPRN
jgi:F-type H+-transporting ATPase subunit b